MIAWVYGSGFPKSHNGEWGGTALKPALEPITMARKSLMGTVAANVLQHGTGALNIEACRVAAEAGGRWPANLIHDGSDEVVAGFPQSVSRPAKVVLAGGKSGADAYDGTVYGGGFNRACRIGYADSNVSAARFFYCAKASQADRGEGNRHPTVKPTALMAYLCRLVTPAGGVVLDPFMGSGSTGRAAQLEGLRFIGIEREAEYFAIAQGRVQPASDLFAL